MRGARGKLNLRLLLLLCVLGASLWYAFSVFSKNTQQYSELQGAQVFQPQKRPLLKEETAAITITSKAALSLLVKEDTTQEILYGQGSEEQLPIASLTKLMTALVTLQSYSLSQVVIITERAVAEEGTNGLLKKGDTFTIQDILALLLIESSNDAATAITGIEGEELFVARMNKEAQKLGLLNTRFFNATGLDPDDLKEPINYSTARDMARLVSFILKEHPELFEILSYRSLALYDTQGIFHHTLYNTNELLWYEGWPTAIVGGKTGWTFKAQGCLILILKGPKNKGYLIQVILGAENRFEQMKKMVDWVYTSYQW